MHEQILITKCKNGDGEAYRHLIKIYKMRLFGYLWRFSNSQYEAEELFQETLIKVWKGMKKYNEQKKFASWLFTIAHNVAMDHLRTKNTNYIFTTIDEIENNLHSENLEKEIQIKEIVNQINKSVEGLSDKQKTVFLLRQHGELSFKEIADLTKEPLNTVISHMHYAVRKIKKQIEIENEPRRKAL
jgi:RNA polymerase sigma-70 factor (ECF subfamily)